MIPSKEFCRYTGVTSFNRVEISARFVFDWVSRDGNDVIGDGSGFVALTNWQDTPLRCFPPAPLSKLKQNYLILSNRLGCHWSSWASNSRKWSDDMWNMNPELWIHEFKALFVKLIWLYVLVQQLAPLGKFLRRLETICYIWSTRMSIILQVVCQNRFAAALLIPKTSIRPLDNPALHGPSNSQHRRPKQVHDFIAIYTLEITMQAILSRSSATVFSPRGSTQICEYHIIRMSAEIMLDRHSNPAYRFSSRLVSQNGP